MKHDRRWVIAVALLAVLVLPACRETVSAGSDGSEPVTLEPVEGTDLTRLILTAEAAERLGIETTAVTTADDRTTVPASAVWLDVDGDGWVYTNPEPLTFVREAISVERFDGEVAVLTDGPSAGTEVVTVGVAELIGSEFGV